MRVRLDGRRRNLTEGDFLFWTVLGLLGLERLWELALSWKHERILLARGAERPPRDGFLAFVIIHSLLFVALPVEWMYAPYSRTGPSTWAFLALAAGAASLRYWVIATLKERWCARVLRLPDVPLVATGPYRWIRHPNYVAVAVELFAVTLAFGCVATSIVLGAANLGALLYRIRVEEEFLGMRPAPSATS